MLAPVSYQRGLTRRFGRAINHKPIESNHLLALRERTKELWDKKYPTEPFDPTYQSTDNDNFQSGFEYDIAEAVQRQKLFFYQVSLPHYQDRSFLKASISRYKMYLYLKSKYSSEFLVPCYDMDVCWHTHQVQPELYAFETKEILGHILPHDDSVNDRAPGSKLNNSQVKLNRCSSFIRTNGKNRARLMNKSLLHCPSCCC